MGSAADGGLSKQREGNSPEETATNTNRLQSGRGLPLQFLAAAVTVNTVEIFGNKTGVLFRLGWYLRLYHRLYFYIFIIAKGSKASLEWLLIIQEVVFRLASHQTVSRLHPSWPSETRLVCSELGNSLQTLIKIKLCTRRSCHASNYATPARITRAFPWPYHGHGCSLGMKPLGPVLLRLFTGQTRASGHEYAAIKLQPGPSLRRHRDGKPSQLCYRRLVHAQNCCGPMLCVWTLP